MRTNCITCKGSSQNVTVFFQMKLISFGSDHHPDSSEARKQYNEYCLSIMQTISYAQKLSIYIYIYCIGISNKVSV
jgi:hypothetical protein